jgi:hypothetical protein
MRDWFLLGSIVGLILGFVLGAILCENFYKQESAKRGFARYQETTGVWEWKESKDE